MKGETINPKNEKLSSSLEDYLEVIFNVLANTEVARSKDIADALGVAKPSVTGALKTLSGKGLVNYTPYGYVTLTEKGRKQAAVIAGKHSIIKSFFVDALGIERVIAETAACKVEHSLGPEIISKLSKFIEFVNTKDSTGQTLAKKFSDFYNNSES